MPQQQQSVELIFGGALDLPPQQRGVFLYAACGGDPKLRRLVEELLLDEQKAGDFLASPVFEGFDDLSSLAHGRAKASEGTEDRVQPRSSRFASGDTIADRFAVVRFLARGGMGEVYEVEDRLLQGAHVALKIIRPEIAADAGSARRFEQEVILARKVIHPNLCPIYEIYHCEEPKPAFLFLTMKLIRGETLAARLSRSTGMVRGEVVSLSEELIAGVAAIHAAGIVHRDIKSNNVMIESSDGRVCASLMDFGLARLHESEYTILPQGLVAGTPGYLAPELFHGQLPTQATDIFALGVVLHEALTGKRPLANRSGMGVSAEPVLMTADAPPELIRAVRGFLSDDPEERCRAFEAARGRSSSHGASYVGSGLMGARWEPARLSRRGFVTAAGATVCAVAGGAMWKREQIYDLLHPLPHKRFVALVNWPPQHDARVRPMVMGLIDAMADELARAEAFDRNFFIAPQTAATEVTTPTQLNEVRESLGANLILATTGVTVANELRILLHVIDPDSGRTLRSKEIQAPLEQQVSLPERVVRAAAELLDVSRFDPDERRSRVGTENPEALAAFQAAETLFKQPNGSHIEEAIEKYKVAVEADSRFAVAHARLARAYLLLYEKHGDPSAIVLARANANTALSLDANAVQSHVALGCVYWETGAFADALHEMGVALSIDPADTTTMTYQAQIYSAQNRWAEAEGAYKRVLRLRPNYWLAYNGLGNTYNRQANYIDALAAYRAAAAAAPTRAIPFNNIASMYLQLGSYGEALTAINRSLDLAPIGGAYQTRSAILRALGRYKDALDSALQGAKLDPEDGANWLEVGDSYAMLPHHPKEAVEAYRTAMRVQQKQVDAAPGDGPACMLLALFHVKSGDPGPALGLVQKAETLGAGDMDSQLFKVRVLALLGLHKEALSTLSALRRKGVTIYQVKTVPDLQSLGSELDAWSADKPVSSPPAQTKQQEGRS